MSPTIRRLVLKRFKSAPSASVELDNPTFLVGHNGSGKSNILSALSFLSDVMSLPLQAVFDAEGGITAVRNRSASRGYPPNLGFGVHFGKINNGIASARYAFEVKALKNYGFQVIREQCVVQLDNGRRRWFDRSKESLRSSERGMEPSLEPTALALPLIGGTPSFAPVAKALSSIRVYSIETHTIREMQDPDSGASLKRDGSNASSVLREIERNSPEDIERICEILHSVVPNTTAVKTKKHGNKLSLEFTQSWGAEDSLRFESFSMSDGTLRALGLLLAVYQRPTPTLIAIEEPEATIHPGALPAVLDLIRHASKRMQVVVTTHSPDVLDADWLEDRHIRIVEWSDGATRIAGLADSTRSALQRHLMGAGELLRSNALEPEQLFTAEPQASQSQMDLFEGIDG